MCCRNVKTNTARKPAWKQEIKIKKWEKGLDGENKVWYLIQGYKTAPKTAGTKGFCESLRVSTKLYEDMRSLECKFRKDAYRGERV